MNGRQQPSLSGVVADSPFLVDCTADPEGSKDDSRHVIFLQRQKKLTSEEYFRLQMAVTTVVAVELF